MASPNTLDHSEKLRLVVMITLVFSYSLLIRHEKHRLPSRHRNIDSRLNRFDGVVVTGDLVEGTLYINISRQGGVIGRTECVGLHKPIQPGRVKVPDRVAFLEARFANTNRVILTDRGLSSVDLVKKRQ